ncbi:ATP-binding protein [Alcanivorax sp. DP30]|uniref:ATP-binding protein n=1 Tax=Alcanivorax sp. DP30 TaxID=2606217 RepID=UPI00136803AD|nr:ATP-binding protein [Alcanivorax sp. DP30]MZR62425.1 HAMP domain-containing protein [Alcanivorax sp. DP30]
MGIRNKLFLIFLGTFLILTLAASGFYYLAFVRSLDTYLDERQQEQVFRLSEHLGTLYQQNGSWAFLLDDPRRLGRLYRLAGDGESERGKRGEMRHLQLLDRDKSVLIGPPAPPKLRTEIPIEADGQTVGYLTHPNQDAIRDKLADRFLDRQKGFMAWMLAVGVGLSLLVSWLLARHLVAPILALTRHAHTLQEGDYSTRLSDPRRDELGTLSRQLDQLSARLEQGQQARQRWFSDIAHELRTPVAILKGELEALVDGVRPLNLAAIQALESETDQLTHLIDDLHDLALADGGNLRYQFQPYDLVSLTLDVLDNYQRTLNQQRLTLKTDLPAQASALIDPVRIRQLLDNLLQNTVKYTQQGGQLHLQIMQQGRQWQLVLEDSAPGVPDDALPQLFDHLYRVENSRNRGTGGAGLGLAICLRIAEAHGGSLMAAHSPLGGVRITLTLPGESA